MKLEGAATSLAFLAAAGAVALAAWLGSSLAEERSLHATTREELTAAQSQLARQEASQAGLEADLAESRKAFQALDSRLGSLRVELSKAQLERKEALAQVANAELARDEAQETTARLKANLVRFDREVRTLSELATGYREQELQTLQAELASLRQHTADGNQPFAASTVLAHDADTGLLALRPTESLQPPASTRFALADTEGLLGTMVVTRTEPRFLIAQWKAPESRAKMLQTGQTVYILPF